jgi:hypothetical protein
MNSPAAFEASACIFRCDVASDFDPYDVASLFSVRLNVVAAARYAAAAWPFVAGLGDAVGVRVGFGVRVGLGVRVGFGASVAPSVGAVVGSSLGVGFTVATAARPGDALGASEAHPTRATMRSRQTGRSARFIAGVSPTSPQVVMGWKYP